MSERTLRVVRLGLIAVLAGCIAPLCPAAPESVREVLKGAGVRGGLVVHVGATDGKLEADLAGTGAYLVHGLAMDEAARDAARRAIMGKGLYGLASVAVWSDRRRLPYASNLATAVVADLDALGPAAPSRQELERIVAPEGLVLLKTNGPWQAAPKPRTAAIDHWMHFDHGADGNPVSLDTAVGPIRQLQWITGVQPNPFEGNPAGYAPGGGIRLWGRFAVLDVNDAYAAEDRRKRDTWTLQGRDAFNGVPLWAVPREAQVSQKRWSLAAGDGEVYAWLKHDGKLTALDMTTGEVLRAYDGTEPGTEGLKEETFCVRVAGSRLVVGLRDRIVCLDRKTASQQWAVRREGKLLLGVVVDESGGRVYCLLARPGDRREFGGRWPNNQNTEALLALRLTDGGTMWECTGIASRDVTRADEKKGKVYRRGPGQIVPAGDRVIVFGSAAISGGSSPYIAAIDAASGKVIHQTDEPFRQNYNVWGYNVLWRDGAAWFAGAFTNVWRFDPASGEVRRVLNDSWNQRCTRFTATPRYFLFGQAAYYDRLLAGEQVCVARSGCAMGNIPANGMTYFTPTACGCITQVRGFQAMTSEAAPPPVPEAQRLVRARGQAVALPTDVSAELPAGPVAGDWPKQWRAGHRETQPVKAGDVELVAVVHQHRLEARRDGKTLWSFVADGRVSSPPVVDQGKAIFGSHDGCVYAVRIADGALLWKLLLAPAERAICVNGQLESSWPVYGVCFAEDELRHVIASAGRHVELDGGVTVAALNPNTGSLAWKKHLQKPHSKVPPGGKGARIVAYSFVNSAPRIEDGRIVLGDGGRKGGRFAFDPSEDAQTLNERLASPDTRSKQ
ncbi:MAG TPA: PQQ-binding-like beta-propeller repeat protein [Phycisphaerae bacterium]|nr:PQQ-binding-like beta-propeller repeat protein [Phycisphaerae bacterium]